MSRGVWNRYRASDFSRHPQHLVFLFCAVMTVVAVVMFCVDAASRAPPPEPPEEALPAGCHWITATSKNAVSGITTTRVPLCACDPVNVRVPAFIISGDHQ